MRRLTMQPQTPEMRDPGDRNAQWRSPECADFDLSRPRPNYDAPPRDTPHVPAASRRGWDLWRGELSMDADWTTFRSPAQAMGLA